METSRDTGHYYQVHESFYKYFAEIFTRYSLAEVKDNHLCLDLIFVLDLLRYSIKLRLVPCHEDDVEAGLGELHAVFLANTV